MSGQRTSGIDSISDLHGRVFPQRERGAPVLTVEPRPSLHKALVAAFPRDGLLRT